MAFKAQQVQQFTNISNPPINNEPQEPQSEYSSSPKNHLYKSNSMTSNSLGSTNNYGSSKENFANRNYIIAGSNNNNNTNNNANTNGNSNNGTNAKCN